MKKLLIALILCCSCHFSFADKQLNDMLDDLDDSNRELAKEMILDIDNMFKEFEIETELNANDSKINKGESDFTYTLFNGFTIIDYITKGGAAEKAGLELGDIILEFNDDEGESLESLGGQGLNLLILRGLDLMLIDIDWKKNNFISSFSVPTFMEPGDMNTLFIKTNSVKASLYSNTFTLKDYSEDLNLVVLFYSYNDYTDYYDFNLPSFILDGNLDENIQTKEISGSKFSINAEDLSDTYEGERNSYVGKVYIKHNGGYYYGTEITPGYFDLRNNYKRKELEKNYKTQGDISAHKNINANISYQLSSYLGEYGTEQFSLKMKNIRKIEPILNNKINKIVSGIFSEKDLLTNKNTFIKHSLLHYRISKILELFYTKEYYLKDEYNEYSSEVISFIDELSNNEVKIKYINKDDALKNFTKKDPSLAKILESSHSLPEAISITTLEGYEGGLDEILDKYKFLFTIND